MNMYEAIQHDKWVALENEERRYRHLAAEANGEVEQLIHKLRVSEQRANEAVNKLEEIERMVDWISPSEDLLAGLQAGRQESNDRIDDLVAENLELHNTNETLVNELKELKQKIKDFTEHLWE